MATYEELMAKARELDAAGQAEDARRMAEIAVSARAAPARIPAGMVENPGTGQITDRQMMAGNMDPGFLRSMGQGYLQGYAWGGADELAGLAGGDYARERFRAESDAAWREHPVGSFLGTLVGGAASAIGAGKAANAGLRALGMTAIGPATTAVGRAGQMAAGGAAGGAIEGFLSGEGDAGNRLRSAGIGAAAGAVLAPTFGFAAAKVAKTAEKVGGKVLARVFSSPRMYDPSTGTLTDDGMRALRTLGYNVDELTDRMNAELAKMADDATSGRMPREVADRLAVANRFDVPLTKGQATGDVAQIATEENFRAATRGPGAYRVISEFDGRQGAAVDAARGGIIQGMEGGRIDAADSVIDAVRREAGVARDAGRAAYNVLEESGAAIRPDAANGLRRSIDLAAQARGARIGDTTPNARAAMDMLDTAFSADAGGAVPFMKMETLRQDLLSLQQAAARGSNGPDQFAMGEVVKVFDEWFDDTITTALVSGDASVLDSAKEARKLWSHYKNTFLGKDGASNFIRKIVSDDLAPDEVAGWLFGSSSHIGGGRTSLVARRVRDILGETSPEWSAVRRAAWDQATIGPSGEMYGPQKISSNLDQLLSGKGQTLSQVLFTPDEMKGIREFRNLMRVLTKPAKATNPSGSSYDIQRAAGQATRLLAGLMGNAAGGPVAGVAASTAMDTGGKFSSAVAARAAAKGVTGLTPSVANPALAVGGTIGGIESARGLITSLQDRGRQ